MNPLLASLVYACGIAGLFYLDRDESIKTSKALWLPVVYLWAIGSRPISTWLGIAPPSGADTALEGSPIDGAFYQILLIAAICALVFRGNQVVIFINKSLSMPILLYFLFCLVSIVWSDFPGPALKKWIKSVEDLLMILVVLTDEQPVAALRRLFSRIGFILLPLSLLFIKYYPSLGRNYDLWTGAQMNTGVTPDKNLLGVIAFVFSLGAVWRILALLRSDENPPSRGRHLLAQGTLLVLGVSLLIDANSATSSTCFVLGAGLMLVTSLRFVRRHPATVHLIVFSLIVIAGLGILVGGTSGVAAALGRKQSSTGSSDTLTGRTEIWDILIPMAPNPLVGAGFESFWLNPHVAERLAERFPNLPLNEAHNGYLEVYLNLGWVGVVLIVLILTDAYRRAVKAFRREPAIGGLLLAYVVTAIAYNITEAAFRKMGITWIFLLLSIMKASSIGFSVSGGAMPLDGPSDRSRGLPARSCAGIEPRRANYGRKGLQ